MNKKLQIYIIFGIIVYFYVILSLLRKKSLELKYTLVWIILGFAMLIICIFPGIMITITRIVGIIDLTNALFTIVIFFMLIILMSLTGIVSKMNQKNKQLIQEYGLLEKRVKELEKNEGESNTEYEVL